MAKPPSARRAPRPAAEEEEEALDEGPPPEGGTMVSSAPSEGDYEEHQESTLDEFEPPPEGATMITTAPTAPTGDGKTMVFDANKMRASAAVPPKLVVTKGQKPGTDYPLTPNPGNEWMVGRGDQCQLVIPDISVSRKHLLLRRKGKDILAIDQGSGNGTLVNGESITEQPLRNGDLVEVGDTVLQFVEPGAIQVKGGKPKASVAIAPAPAPRGRAAPIPGVDSTGVMNNPRPLPAARRPLPPGAAKAAPPKAAAGGSKKGLLFAVVAVFAILLVAVVLKMKMGPAEPDLPPPPQGPTPKELAASALASGIDLVRDQKWEASQAKFAEALQLDPQSDEAKRYLERANKEVSNEKGIAEAKACLAKDDLKCASQAFTKVDKDSLVYEQSGAPAAKALEEARSKKLADTTTLVDAAKTVDEAATAAAAAADLAAVWPDDATLTGLSERAKAKLEELTRKEVCRKNPKRCQPPPKVVDPNDAAAAKASELYGQGKISDAIEALKEGTTPKTKDMAKKLAQFQKAYDAGMDAEGAAALKSLETARKIDQALGGNAKFGKAMGQKLGKIYYAAGVEAKAAENLERAYTNFEKAVDADPGHSSAKNEMSTMRSKAKDIYLSGYVEREQNPESAKQKFKLVLKITPPGDENHEKAKKWLDKIEGKGGGD